MGQTFSVTLMLGPTPESKCNLDKHENMYQYVLTTGASLFNYMY